jgi:hypothetical protein
MRKALRPATVIKSMHKTRWGDHIWRRSL